jgi:hypothetical protein
MPSVTELILEVSPLASWTAASASFLTEFPRLQHVVLDLIFDARRLDDDIPHMAALTKLTRLELAPCILDYPGAPFLDTYVSQLDTKLQPLTALKKLEEICIIFAGSRSQHALNQTLCEKMRAVRQEMGLPPPRHSVHRRHQDRWRLEW